MNKVAEIKKLYFGATAGTIRRDLARAIDVLKSMNSEEERERVAVYMDGLSQMRSEWTQGKETRKQKTTDKKQKGRNTKPDAGGGRRSSRDGRSGLRQ